MSVRRQKRTNKKGETRTFWIVDVAHVAADGKETRVRHVPRDQTHAGAKRREREIIRELEAGTYGKRKISNPTFAAFALEYERERLTRSRLKPSSIDIYKRTIKGSLIPHFGHMRLDAIDARAIEAFKAKKIEEENLHGRPYSKHTINNQLIKLKTMLRIAAKWGALRSTPEIVRLKAGKKRINFLDFEEAEAFKAMLRREPRWHALFCTALNTGMRIGELIALRWDNVSLSRRRLLVCETNWRGHIGSPKGGISRTIPLNDEAYAVLKKHRHLRGPLVFCQASGKELDPKTCRDALVRICRRAQVKAVKPHDLRHTFASHLVMRGVPLKAVQELLGHANIEMTMVYAHLTPDFREEAVARLGPPKLERPPTGNESEAP